MAGGLIAHQHVDGRRIGVVDEPNVIYEVEQG